MIPFELAEPTSLAAAIKLLDPDDETIRPIAGGTALMLMMKAGVFRPAKLVSLRKIERAIHDHHGRRGRLDDRRDDDALGSLERSADVRKHAPLITRTLLTLSNVRVRNVATVGGAMAHGDPHMDLPPVLMALGASLIVAGPDGERSLPVEDLFSGYYETVLAKNELITSVQVPAQGSKRAAYMKVTTGSVDDWPALGVAVVHRWRRRHHQVGAHRRQRRDREGHAADVGRSGSQRQRASTRRSLQRAGGCGGGRGGIRRRRARLGAVQARTDAGLCPARRCARPGAARGADGHG